MKRILQICFGGEPAPTVIVDGAQTLLRVAAGVMLALGHGVNKVPPAEGFIGAVGDLGFPMPTLFAWLAAFAELVGGLCLAVGLLTRPAAFLIAVTMAVAAGLQHATDPWFASEGPSKELAVLYLVIALQFLAAGSGRYSIDRFWRRMPQG